MPPDQYRVGASSLSDGRMSDAQMPIGGEMQIGQAPEDILEKEYISSEYQFGRLRTQLDKSR